VKDAVEGVRKGLDEEGMGDLKASVRGQGIPAETRRIERRPEHKGERILVPTVVHAAKSGVRPLDFDADILGAVNWEALHYDGGEHLDLETIGAARAKASFDFTEEGALERIGAVERVALTNDVDRPDLARRLLGLIPNPWIGMRLVDEGLAALRARKVSDEKIAKGRLDLIDSMRVELEEKVDAMARAVFESKLEAGTISFRLHGQATDWQIPEWTEVEFRPGLDAWEVNNDGDQLQRTLFAGGIKRGELNDFERDVALYVDGSDAVAWWWRLASRGAWGLQGWRRHKVYPDFLIRPNGDGKRFLVLETKGKQLDNDDTKFKRDLMAALQRAYRRPPAGEVELFDDSPDAMKFKMLMQEADWRPNLGLNKAEARNADGPKP
jgi:type III restriction enzyme